MRGLRGAFAICMGVVAGCLSVPDAQSSDGSTGGDCPVGLEGCPCSAANTCFAQLVCVDGRCAAADDSSSTTTATASTTASSVTSDGTMSTTTPATSGETDDSTSSTGGTTDTTDTTGSTGVGSTGDGIAHMIFVSSQAFDGNSFSGLAEADEECATLGGQGKWIAVLRDSSTTFAERISINGPVYRMDGVLVADTGEQFFNSQLAAPVNRDQNEQAVSPNTRVWVGSMSDNCNDWSGGGGGGVQGRTVEVGDSEFLAGTEAHTCGENNRLFCISQAGEP